MFKIKEIADKDIKAFVNACHRIGAYGLIRCSSGNLSFRLDQQNMIMSASRSWLGELTEEQIAVCRIEDGKVLNDKTPTVESVFHLGILRKRAEINVVLHFQSPFATAIACGQPDDYDFSIIPEVPFYIAPIAVVEYIPPGSVELADRVIEVMSKHNMAILRNHGLVTVGRDYNEAIQRACFFELACQILICQNNLQPLSQAAINDLLKKSSGV